MEKEEVNFRTLIFHKLSGYDNYMNYNSGVTAPYKKEVNAFIKTYGYEPSQLQEAIWEIDLKPIFEVFNQYIMCRPADYLLKFQITGEIFSYMVKNEHLKKLRDVLVTYNCHITPKETTPFYEYYYYCHEDEFRKLISRSMPDFVRTKTYANGIMYLNKSTFDYLVNGYKELLYGKAVIISAPNETSCKACFIEDLDNIKPIDYRASKQAVAYLLKELLHAADLEQSKMIKLVNQV